MIVYATPALSEEEVKRIADEAFRVVLGDRAAPEVTVEARENFDGDPSYYILALVPDGAPRPDSKHQTQMQLGLSKALISRGELRFPYVRVLTTADLEELASDADSLPDA